MNEQREEKEAKEKEDNLINLLHQSLRPVLSTIWQKWNE